MKKFTLFIFILFAFKFSFSQQQKFIKEGNKFFKNGKLDDAVASYDKVTDANYKPTALLNKGTALFKLKKFDEAAKAYQQVSSSSSADALLKSGAYYNAGVVYSNQSKIDESIEAYKAALRLNPEDNNARENLQKALLEKRKNGGGGNAAKPQPTQSKLNKNQAQQELDRLEQKEKNTQSKVAHKKTQFKSSNGKDW